MVSNPLLKFGKMVSSGLDQKIQNVGIRVTLISVFMAPVMLMIVMALLVINGSGQQEMELSKFTEKKRNPGHIWTVVIFTVRYPLFTYRSHMRSFSGR